MGHTGELPNISGFSAGADIDKVPVVRKVTGDDPSGKAGDGASTVSSLDTGDKGTTAVFAHAAYEPTVSFEWSNLKQLNSLAAPRTVGSNEGLSSDGTSATKHVLQVAGSEGSNDKFSSSDLQVAGTLIFRNEALGTSTSEVGGLKPEAARLLGNAETLVSQLRGVDRYDAFAAAGLDRLQTAIEGARAFPDAPEVWEKVYAAMLALRGSLETFTAGTSIAVESAAEAFRSVPSQVTALLEKLHVPDVTALQAKLGVPQTGILDGKTFVTLELTLLESEAVTAGAIGDAAVTVANHEVRMALGQASFVRDTAAIGLMEAVKRGTLSEEAQWYLTAMGYAVDGATLVDTTTGQAVGEADLATVGAKLVKGATDTLMYTVVVLNKDETIHLQALKPAQQQAYKLTRQALDAILGGKTATSSTDAIAQLVVVQKLGLHVSGIAMKHLNAFRGVTGDAAVTADGPAEAPAPVDLNKSTLEQWCTTGMTRQDLAALPLEVQQNLQPFLRPVGEDHFQLQMSDGEMEQALAMMAFVDDPPSPEAKVLVADLREVAHQARTARAVQRTVQPDQPPLRLSDRDLAALAYDPATTSGLPYDLPTLALPPLTFGRHKGKHRKHLHLGKADWGPKIRRVPGKRRTTIGGVSDASGDGDARASVRSQGLPTAAPTTGTRAAFVPLALIQDDIDFTTRMSAKRFAQQVRSQQVHDQAVQVREAYKASLDPDSVGKVPVAPPPATPTPGIVPD